MRWNGVFCPHLCTLHNAETVLLVNDHKTQIAEQHIVLQHSMGTYKDVNLTILKRLEKRHPLLGSGAAGEQLHPHRQVAQHAAQCSEMLFGKYFSGGKQAGLVAVVLGKQHRHQCHKSLSAAHIALQQTIHLPFAVHVGAYLFNHPLLGVRELERQLLAIETVEHLAHLGKTVPHITHLALLGIVQDV